jgi:hypothetical protein
MDTKYLDPDNGSAKFAAAGPDRQKVFDDAVGGVSHTAPSFELHDAPTSSRGEGSHEVPADHAASIGRMSSADPIINNGC